MPSRRLQFLACLLLLCVVTACAGCDGVASPPTKQDKDSATASPTVVSLSPAITQMLIDMGKRPNLVGVSTDDRADELGLPACGTYNQPDIERLLTLAPELVLTEAPGGQMPTKLQKLADAGVFKLVVLPHSLSISEVGNTLTDPDHGLGVVMDDPAAAAQAQHRMQQQLKAIAAVVSDRERPRVLLVLSPGSLGVIGPKTTHDELLTLAGGLNAAESFNTTYIQLSRAQVQTQARPDVILIIQPGGTPLTKNDSRLRPFEGMTVPAVRDGRIVLIDHPLALLPSTSLPTVVAEIAKAIYPGDAATIQRAVELAGRSDASSPGVQP